MIFTSESGLRDPGREAEWALWYLDHLEVMAAVPGIGSAQRLIAMEEGPPPSLALYTVSSPAVFDSEIYLRTRGMGPWRELIDQRHYRRNLFDGLDVAPKVPVDGILLVADRDAPQEKGLTPQEKGLTWLRSVGLDRSTPFRGLAVLPDAAAARRLATAVGEPVALYRPVTARLIGLLG